jgi:hypothetical protein
MPEVVYCENALIYNTLLHYGRGENLTKLSIKLQKRCIRQKCRVVTFLRRTRPRSGM